ncbi:hypothetical protein OC709_02345 ['Planchonia careya' phytoplasma]|nr:hypothetical protein ['Planchonia careya' phytoplasma]MDO8030338.1 hypothetical protein ['Planchonia careya' phytoplasma]
MAAGLEEEDKRQTAAVEMDCWFTGVEGDEDRLSRCGWSRAALGLPEEEDNCLPTHISLFPWLSPNSAFVPEFIENFLIVKSSLELLDFFYFSP